MQERHIIFKCITSGCLYYALFHNHDNGVLHYLTSPPRLVVVFRRPQHQENLLFLYLGILATIYCQFSSQSKVPYIPETNRLGNHDDKQFIVFVCCVHAYCVECTKSKTVRVHIRHFLERLCIREFVLDRNMWSTLCKSHLYWSDSSELSSNSSITMSCFSSNSDCMCHVSALLNNQLPNQNLPQFGNHRWRNQLTSTTPQACSAACQLSIFIKKT